MPLPPGPWTPLLIGEHWPDGSSLATLASAAARRAALAQAFEDYADTLQSTRFGPLAEQEGVTADTVNASFLHGEHHARELANKNFGKQSAYASARDTVEALRASLRDIAQRGNAAIERIRSSGAKRSDQVEGINDVIARAREEAACAAAIHCDGIFGEVQKVLTASAFESSSRAFAAGHGFPGLLTPPPPSDLSERVGRMLTGTAWPAAS